jgi:hypothetical protein
MVYNFSHTGDELHDDTISLPERWKKIRPNVVAVDITGSQIDGADDCPSHGDHQIAMMRNIQEAGGGPTELIAKKGGDSEVTLKNFFIGLECLAAKLRQSGSERPRTFSMAYRV